MTNAKKAYERRELLHHLDGYRGARRKASLHTLRGQDVPVWLRDELGFHAQGIAEALDRLDGRTL